MNHTTGKPNDRLGAGYLCIDSFQLINENKMTELEHHYFAGPNE